MTILGQMLVEDGIEKEKVYEKIMERYHYSREKAVQETDRYWEDQE